MIELNSQNSIFHHLFQSDNLLEYLEFGLAQDS